MDFTEILAIFAIVAPIIYKFVDFTKFLTNKDWNSAVTQAETWLAGIALLFLLSRSDFAASLTVGAIHFDQVKGATIIFIGLAGGSIASAGYDWKKSRDNSDSAATPALIPTIVKRDAA